MMEGYAMIEIRAKSDKSGRGGEKGERKREVGVIPDSVPSQPGWP